MFPYSLSVFFPAYNDAGSLPELVGETFRVLERHVAEFEVIVVNDGSRDNTGEVLEQLQMQHGERLRVVQHQKNRGYGGALRSGFGAATKEYVFYTDGDAQYDVGELPLLLEAARHGATWVNGYKRERSDPWHRVLLGAVYREFARALFGLRLRDVDCDFRLIQRSAMDGLTLRSNSGTICVELVWGLERKGLRALEMGVTHRARQHGRSEFFRLASLWKTLRELGRLLSLRLRGAANSPRA
ncbi:MAG: glycosyltransferase family 2 protein [Bryobacterales bacterium]|nr:glycosyltransferase family 2 protein [Bryobacterales bacterium]